MEPQCTATNRHGARCGRRAIPGGTVCNLHGGKAPQVAAKAAQRVAERQLDAAVATFGLRVETTPGDALLDEVQWTAGHVAWLRAQVQQLDPKALTFGITKVEHVRSGLGNPGKNTTKEARINALIDLYERERAHLVKVCAAAIQCGLEERRVRLAERQGALVADGIRRILTELQLTQDQQARVPIVVPAVLRQLATAG